MLHLETRLDGLVAPIVLCIPYRSVEQIVDKLEQWHFETGANGGFMLARGFSAPGNLQEFVDLVVPELQRRGLSKKEYAGPRLRDNLLQ